MPGPLALLVGLCCLRLAAAAEVDLLGAMSLHNSTRQGVVPVTVEQRPAFQFSGDNRELELPPQTFQRATELLKESPEFTMMATLKQELDNSGTIISFSHGYNRYLEMQSSGRKDEVRLHYVAAGSDLAKMECFPYRLADNKWHRVAISVSGTEVEVFMDCNSIYKKIIPLPDRNFTQPQLSLWLGQRNGRHSFFKGTLLDVKIVTGPHGYTNQCPNVRTACPTCGQYSVMESRIQVMEEEVKELKRIIKIQQERLSAREGCDCQKSCVINNTIHADGATWQKDCNLCSCVKGEISCRPVECAPSGCKNPVLHPGDCCPTCLKQCSLKGVIYEHGVQVSLKQCVECECRNGVMGCVRVDPEQKCPPLPCSASEQFSVPGECCNFCPGVDYCSRGHNCHENASCINFETEYSCKCNQGFQGDGKTCTDVDECLSNGDLWGHHCHLHTKCTNTIGSYVCQCEEGYARSDKFNCIEVDECASGEHRCSPNAHCVNTAGSYSCHCIQGYKGDGYDCQPICTGGCLNGGVCVSPEVCSCRSGFTGAHCERDLDECSAGAHGCPHTATCVNMPGWYYCKCRPGYRSLLGDAKGGDLQPAACQDINECLEGLHTCHQSAQCVNTEGSFQCTCSTTDCRLSCIHEGSEKPDGLSWLEAGGCRSCSCARGVAVCGAVACACGAGVGRGARGSAAPPACCPQCDAANDCRHQELHHVLFHSGERWVYQCQTCECLLGEVDCWELECPGGSAERCCPPPLEPPSVPPCAPNSSTPCPRALHHAAPDCQMPYCASLVSNIACCVHRNAWLTTAVALLWSGALLRRGRRKTHRKHRGVREARSPDET